MDGVEDDLLDGLQPAERELLEGLLTSIWERSGGYEAWSLRCPGGRKKPPRASAAPDARAYAELAEPGREIGNEQHGEDGAGEHRSRKREVPACLPVLATGATAAVASSDRRIDAMPGRWPSTWTPMKAIQTMKLTLCIGSNVSRDPGPVGAGPRRSRTPRGWKARRSARSHAARPAAVPCGGTRAYRCSSGRTGSPCSRASARPVGSEEDRRTCEGREAGRGRGSSRPRPRAGRGGHCRRARQPLVAAGHLRGGPSGRAGRPTRTRGCWCDLPPPRDQSSAASLSAA